MRRTLHRVRASSIQRAWVLDSDNACSSGYLTVAFRLRGPLDRELLNDSLSDLVERHEALRTTFELVGSDVEMVVWEHAPVSVVETDLRSHTDPKGAVGPLISEEAQRTFRFADGPLWSAHALRLSADESLLVLLLHHILVDAWSEAVVRREFTEIYAARAGGSKASLEPAAPLRSYVEHEHLRSTPKVRAHWAASTIGRPSRCGLMFPQPPMEEAPVAVVGFPTVSPETMSRVTEISASVRASRSIGVLAAVGAALAAEGDESVVAAVLFNNRYDRAYASTVGCTITFLPVLLPMTGNPSFRQLVERAQRAWLLTLANRLSVDDIMALKGFQKSESPFPFCDMLFNYLPFDERRSSALGSRLVSVIEPCQVELAEDVRRNKGRALCAWWELMLVEDEAGGAAPFIYTIDIEDAASIANRFGSALGPFLEQLAAEPDRPFNDLA